MRFGRAFLAGCAAFFAWALLHKVTKVTALSWLEKSTSTWTARNASSKRTASRTRSRHIWRLGRRGAATSGSHAGVGRFVRADGSARPRSGALLACCLTCWSILATKIKRWRFTTAFYATAPLQQPPERIARYAFLQQKQNRSEEAMEQYTRAAELFTAAGREEDALFCLERIAQLDPENPARQMRLAEAAEKAKRSALAARAYLRAAQLATAREANTPTPTESVASRSRAGAARTQRGAALRRSQTACRHGRRSGSDSRAAGRHRA